MPRGRHNSPRGRSPKEGATPTSILLTEVDRAKAKAIAGSITSGVELALELIDICIDAAHRGDKNAITLLEKIGISVEAGELEPTIVRKKDGTIAAWIF